MTKRIAATLLAMLGATLALVGFGAAAGAAPYSPTPTVNVSTTNPSAGGSITVSCSGFGANDPVTISIAGQSIGTATTDSSGACSATVTLPSGLTGAQTIVLTDATTGQTASIAITIGASTSSSGGGTTSNTGVAVLSIGSVGVLLLIGGAALLIAGRRRQVNA